jgi:hypothetical protein
MNATYATILLVSALHGDPYDYTAVAFRNQADCGRALGLFSEVWKDNDMMARCIRTNIVTSSSAPIPRPDDLMEAYDE